MRAPLLDLTGHRPFPPPAAPWVMAQRWYDLLFAHWPLPADRLRPAVPANLPIDTFDGRAWLGIVPFRIAGLRARGLPPLPWLSAFPELNVRTYVTLDDRPGVYFFSLDAARKAAVIAARTLFHLRYFHAEMRVHLQGDDIVYSSRRIQPDHAAARFLARFRPAGTASNPAPGSLDHWLTERYCLYSVGPRGNIYRVDIHHPPWNLQPAAASFHVNSMAAPIGLQLAEPPATLHFARAQHVIAWAPTRLPIPPPP